MLDDILKQWRTFLTSEKNLSVHTVRAYTADVDGFLSFLGARYGRPAMQRDLAAITLTDFRAWLSHMAAAGAGISGRGRALASVKNLYKWMGRHDIAHNTDLAAVQSAKRPHKLPRPVPAASIDRLIEPAGSGWQCLRDHALFMLLYGCGLRINEALALNIADLPRDGFLRVLGKGGRERQVPVLKIVDRAIAAYLQACPQPATAARPLFVGMQGGRLNQGCVQRAMRERRAACGMPATVTPHALRHSFASHLLQGNANLREIQELLGHASLSTTQIYAELDDRKLMADYHAAMPRR